ncbi:C-X-C chemokine receptor type 1-like [Austrofundulus limnaeus]|uniref:C-X-C chemokine receptor type 1-like n=1 Tax=Austrofundulus limnaeus TaxID=52670 RepID=A0A2I4C684_AUSLI|nr:PREDICTED: C-X-C chemokine receptor type 1-like [Austrofundulus limnaeus]
MSISFEIEDFYDTNSTAHYDLNPDTFSCNPKHVDPTVALILCLVLIINFLLAVPGNVLVGWVIISTRQVLTSSDVYLLHLTLADGLMALTLPFFAVELIQGWLFGGFMCKFLNLVLEANFYTSIIFLTCISVDRYLVIVCANESNRSHQRRCSRLLCVGVWVLGWALALPALFHNVVTVKDSKSERFVCMETFNIGRVTSWRLATRVFRHVFGFLVPLVVMMACYSVTIVQLMRTRGFQKHRAMRVIIAVVVAFLLCWMPNHITLLADTLIRVKLIPFDCSSRMSVNLALYLTNTLALLHSCINPFLYAFVGEKFRKKMMLLLQRKLRQKRTSGSTFSRSTSQTSEGTGTFL